ncbi:reverse transcriptase domain-containing protein [Tanacetum coccineum]|uniref:Reverse transcriptase domain-containing protein n=1 Tax=Tanacetum coccineum TaxID=301880 RepID=A0ABQ5F6Z0_9ASTR
MLQHSRYLKYVQATSLEIGLKDALVRNAKVQQMFPEKLEDPRKFLIPCALQELNRTSALADSGASINLLPHSIYKKLELEALTPTLGKDELVYYADKSEKNKEKNFVHAISVIDFSKDDPFSGSTTTHSDDPSPSSSPVKTSDNFEKFADELAPLDSLPPGNDDSTLKKDLHEENFQEDTIMIDITISAIDVSSNKGRIFSIQRSRFLIHHEISHGNFQSNYYRDSFTIISPILDEDSDPTQEEIGYSSLFPDNLIPPVVNILFPKMKVNEFILTLITKMYRHSSTILRTSGY